MHFFFVHLSSSSSVILFYHLLMACLFPFTILDGLRVWLSCFGPLVIMLLRERERESTTPLRYMETYVAPMRNFSPSHGGHHPNDGPCENPPNALKYCVLSVHTDSPFSFAALSKYRIELICALKILSLLSVGAQNPFSDI